MQISEDHIGRAIRTSRWKYSVWAPSDRAMSGWACGDSDVYHEQHLYDLAEDPCERIELVREPAYGEVRAGLARTLKRRMAEAGEREPRILPACEGWANGVKE